MNGLTPRERELAEASDGMTASLVQQLHSLIRLLESRPELPVSAFGSTSVQYSANSAAEVGAIAAALGVKAEWNKERTHFSAEYKVGREVSYRAVYITPAHMVAYREHMAAFQADAGAVAA